MKCEEWRDFSTKWGYGPIGSAVYFGRFCIFRHYYFGSIFLCLLFTCQVCKKKSQYMNIEKKKEIQHYQKPGQNVVNPPKLIFNNLS